MMIQNKYLIYARTGAESQLPKSTLASRGGITFKASDRVSLDSYTGTVQASSYFIDGLEYIDIVWDEGTERMRKNEKVRRTLTSTKNLQLLSVEGTRPPRACRAVDPARRIPSQ
jgi:hypothetical protein